MSSMKVLNMAGAEVGTVELNDEIFGITPNPVAVHEVVKNHLANCRQGTQSALTRAEVSGGGRKPWRQKGTGHARQGSTRAPQWTHGGIVFAPKPRDYSYVLNKKVKRLALKSVLSAKAAEGKLVVIDSIKMDAIKTADFRKFLSAVKVDGKAVVVTPEVDNVIVKSALTRAEVSGGGRKPWRQKGTGHARQGSTRAPQWTHGGIVFAPKPRDYSYVLNKKVKRLALKSVLSAKAAEGKLVVIDSIKMDAIKTADFRKFLSAVKVDGKAVVVTPEVDNVIVKSARNIPGVLTTVANILSVYDIINAQYLVVDQAALAKIEEVYA